MSERAQVFCNEVESVRGEVRLITPGVVLVHGRGKSNNSGSHGLTGVLGSKTKPKAESVLSRAFGTRTHDLCCSMRPQESPMVLSRLSPPATTSQANRLGPIPTSGHQRRSQRQRKETFRTCSGSHRQLALQHGWLAHCFFYAFHTFAFPAF